MTQKTTIFLASSKELEAERKEFEQFIGRRNKQWLPESIFLHLDVWEDFDDSMSATGKQDDCNTAILASDRAWRPRQIDRLGDALADFVQDLKDDIAAISAAESDMDFDDQEGVASTTAVGRLIKVGMAEVAQLEPIVNNKYARNPEKLPPGKAPATTSAPASGKRNPQAASPRHRCRSSRHWTMKAMYKRKLLPELGLG